MERHWEPGSLEDGSDRDLGTLTVTFSSWNRGVITDVPVLVCHSRKRFSKFNLSSQLPLASAEWIGCLDHASTETWSRCLPRHSFTSSSSVTKPWSCRRHLTAYMHWDLNDLVSTE